MRRIRKARLVTDQFGRRWREDDEGRRYAGEETTVRPDADDPAETFGDFRCWPKPGEDWEVIFRCGGRELVVASGTADAAAGHVPCVHVGVSVTDRAEVPVMPDEDEGRQVGA